MGLLGRLAKLGGGFIRQVITPDEKGVDQILEAEQSRPQVSPQPAPSVPKAKPKASPEDSSEGADAVAVDPSTSVPGSSETDAQDKEQDNEDVQSTERDGNRRSL
jgi:hypothetical protein